MEYEKIKQLMDDMGNSKLSSIEIEFPDGTKISMTKDGKKAAKVVDNIDVEENIECSATAVETKQEQITGNIVKSPMVGTFYAKPSPTAEPFVEVGQVVKKGETLCIIEAMKLMNEIESEFDGKIKEILVSDGEAVEYGKPLYIIE